MGLETPPGPVEGVARCDLLPEPGVFCDDLVRGVFLMEVSREVSRGTELGIRDSGFWEPRGEASCEKDRGGDELVRPRSERRRGGGIELGPGLPSAVTLVLGALGLTGLAVIPRPRPFSGDDPVELWLRCRLWPLGWAKDGTGLSL